MEGCAVKGLYIHIPFCVRKCLYCDFVSVTDGGELFEKYIGAVLKEAEEYRGETADTVFIGGGTPTVLPPVLISRLLCGINKIFNIDADAEITCEANPGTLDADKASALKSGGVNRISLGVQSFNDNELKAIGRIHDAKTAYDTVCELSGYFSDISIDLMTALPNQDMESITKTLETAVSLPVTHISAYSLIIEDGTPLKKLYSEGKLHIPDEDADRDIYHFTVDFLKHHGFLRYEISNFAKRGFESRHNLKYWNCDEYIGLGAAAHSYAGNRRFSNTMSVAGYISGNNKREETMLSREDKISEFMMLGLRKSAGVSEVEFERRFDVRLTELFGKELNRFVSLGAMEYSSGRYFLTDRGIDVSNSIMCDFMI